MAIVNEMKWSSCSFHARYLAVNLAAFNNLLQMFTSSMSLNGAKLPLLVPPNSSSNLTLNSPHGSNQSSNLQEQQQQQQQQQQQSHPLNSPRTPLSSGSTSAAYNNESALFMCGSGAYNNLVPNPNNLGVHHHSQNGNGTGHLATPNNSHYPPTIPSLYGNSASALPTSGAGRWRNMTMARWFPRFDSDTHHNLQNLVALSQMNNGGKRSVSDSVENSRHLSSLVSCFSFALVSFSASCRQAYGRLVQTKDC